jgi:clan AA aspartic protease (TIGR02281 family)
MPRYVFLLFLGVLLIGAALLFVIIIKTPQEEMASHAEPTRASGIRTVSVKEKGRSLIIGSAVVQNLEGKRVAGFVSAIFNDNWFAAPVWSLLEGKGIVFQSSDFEEAPIERGFWAPGDPIALWQLETDKGGKTPELFAWKQYIPVLWHSILRKDTFFEVDISSPEKRGSFFIFPLPNEIKENGLFIQEGHIVGWTFPEWMDRGYLWSGPEGSNISPNIQMDRFCNSIVSGWKETKLKDVLTMGEGKHAVRRLEAFAEVLLMDSQFSDEDVPPQFSSKSLIGLMDPLASGLIKNGFAGDVARIISEHIIIETRDFTLLKKAVLARVEAEGYHKAIQFLERVKGNVFVAQGHEVSGMNQFHARLYKDWLKKILNQGGYYNGMVAFEEAKQAFPDDLELHLLGVEVALAEKNWERARELLQMRDYPETMRNWVNELENVIQEVQENEGAVLIRFNPGTRHIPVKIFLNGSHSLKFIIDTGATICSIPPSAVEKLGIEIDQTTPVRLISTAGGIAETYEVKLESVELGGFRVFDVEALIIDIPGFRGYGLLGQNFLNNFHIEIDNMKGILRLKKR